jgi:hypothetical protein
LDKFPGLLSFIISYIYISKFTNSYQNQYIYNKKKGIVILSSYNYYSKKKYKNYILSGNTYYKEYKKSNSEKFYNIFDIIATIWIYIDSKEKYL